MMSGIIETNGKGSTPNNEYLFGGDFSKGTAPTLLESSEAQRVKRFIENLVFRSIYQIKTGTPDKNLLRLNLTDPGQAVWELDLRTALECDPDPTLAADLILLGHGIRATRPGGTGDGPYFHQFGTDGFTVVPENWPAATSAGLGGKIRLAFGAEVAGFVAQAMSSSCIWTLPDSDGADGQMLSTNGSFVLSWADAVGSGTVTNVLTEDGTFIELATTPALGITTSGTVTADLSATGTASSTTYLRGDNSWASIPAGGTVTSVATSDSTFIDLTPDSPITTTGTISAALSATGSASASTFLRGDNSWATPSGAGTVTSVATSDSTFIDLTPDSPITATGTISAELSATGTADSTTYLRGDNTWHAPDGSGTVTSITGGADSGSGTAITTAGTLTVAGGTNCTTSVTGTTITVDSTDEFTGTVQSIEVSGGTTGLTFSGGPVTSSGTITMGGGPLNAGYGGTDQDSYTTGDLLFASSSSSLTTLGIGSTGYVLKVGSGGDPEWDSDGSGTVTSIATSDGTFIDLTPNLPITTTGTISADLSATGTADDTTYLRGDNTWHTPAGSGTVTSVDVAGGGSGLVFGGGPVTSSGTITMGGTLAANYGGTGYDDYTIGDILYANTTSTFSKLAAGDDGQFLKLDSGVPTWAAGGSGTGTVTSVDINPASTGFLFTGGPITTSGSITIGGTLAADYGGTGQSSYTAGDLLVATTATALTPLGIGAEGYVLKVSVGGAPEWAAAGSGSGTVTSVATSDSTFIDLTPDSAITTTGTISAALSATGTASSSTYLRGDNTWATIAAGGTVTAVATSNGTFVNVTGGTITTSGTVTADLSATGSASSTTFLRGDNTWAVPAGGGGGAPTDAKYVTLALDGDLTAERVLTAGTNITIVDGGANSTVTIASTDEYTGTVTSITPAADAGSGTAITTSGTLTLAGGTNVTTSVSGTTITVNSTDQYSGTVTSVGVSGGTTGLTFSGSPITSSGTMTLGGGTLKATSGGTGFGVVGKGDLMYCVTPNYWQRLTIGTENQVLTVGGDDDPKWETPGSGGTVTSVATSNGTFVNVSGGTITTTGTVTADLSATGTASVSTFLRGDNSWATPAGAGTVTSVATSDSTFIDLTPDSAITTTGTISAALSATGSASSTTFLRGDNTWATPSGGGSGTVTSVAISGGSTGLDFTGTPITTSGTLTVADSSVLLADYGGTGLSAASYAKGDLIYCSDVTDSVPTLDLLDVGVADTVLATSSGLPVWNSIDGMAQTKHTFYADDMNYLELGLGESSVTFTSSDGSIDTSIGTGTIDFMVAGGPPPSDKAFKREVKNLKGSLGKIKELRPVEFDWNETAKREVKKEGHDIGLIAQEVEQIIPEAVGTRGEFKTLDYAKLTPVLIAAIQELSSEVKDLNARLLMIEHSQF